MAGFPTSSPPYLPANVSPHSTHTQPESFAAFSHRNPPRIRITRRNMPGVKREYTATPEPSDPATPPKKAKKTPTPRKEKATPDGKKTGGWNGDELLLLYGIMAPKQTKVDWDAVAEKIPGRDKKSCINKWTRIQGKIQEAIKSLGD
ncbi:hypothetical protein P7C73_g4792, partial [Tremellales sp. Uapishka_1]